MILRHRKFLPSFRSFTPTTHQVFAPSFSLRRKSSLTFFTPSKNLSKAVSLNSKLSIDNYIRTAVNKKSTIFRGTVFEFSACDALALYGMQLHRVGRSGDGGVDLRGFWSFPDVKNTGNNDVNNTGNNTEMENGLQSLYVIAQCKYTKTGCTPEHMRSLIGAMVLQAATVTMPMIGLLITSSKFSKQVTKEFKGCSAALGLAIVTGGKLQSLMLNLAAEKLLPGYAITMTYRGDGETSVTMTYCGKVIKFV